MISKPDIEGASPLNAGDFPAWPGNTSGESPQDFSPPSHLDALQALIAFSALHEQVRRRKTLAAQYAGFDQAASTSEFEPHELFVLDEVLQLVAERAVAITGADGLAIALAENNEIVLRAAAGMIRPDVGARIDRDSAFTGACFRSAQVVSCHDTETDARVNLTACRRLGARSMIAVPLCGRRRVIGLLEAFSAEPYGFNDSDVRNLSLLAELVLGALKPEDEDRFAQSAQVAETKLEAAAILASAPAQATAPQPTRIETARPTPSAAPSAVKLDSKSAAEIVESPTPKLAGVKPESTTAESLATAEPSPEVTSTENIREAFAAGAWWKLKYSQPAPALTQTEKPTPKVDEPPAPQSATATAAKDASEGANPEDANSQDTPASSQELGKFPQVTGIRHWSSADASTIVLDLEDQVQYEAHRLAGPDRIYFDLHDTQLPPDLTGKSIDIGDALLNRVRVAQPVAGMTRVVLETKANTNFSVSLEPNPYRLVVEVRKIGAAPKAAVNLFPNAGSTEKNKLSIVVPPPTKE